MSIQSKKRQESCSFFWISLEEWSQGTNDDSQDSVRSVHAAIWYTLAGTAPTVFKCSDKTHTVRTAPPVSAYYYKRLCVPSHAGDLPSSIVPQRSTTMAPQDIPKFKLNNGLEIPAVGKHASLSLSRLSLRTGDDTEDVF